MAAKGLTITRDALDEASLHLFAPCARRAPTARPSQTSTVATTCRVRRASTTLMRGAQERPGNLSLARPEQAKAQPVNFTLVTNGGTPIEIAPQAISQNHRRLEVNSAYWAIRTTEGRTI
jgi:hypothetical protein